MTLRGDCMTKFLAFDVEAGGTEVEHSLLSVYFAVIDEDLKTVYGELDLLVKPDNGNYVMTAQALEVNKINIIEHDKVAITESKAGTLLYNFLKTHAPNGTVKLIPLGHNIAFDVDFIKKHLLNKSFNQFVSYRMLDTSAIVQFLKLRGSIPRDLAGSLSEIATHFGVSTLDNVAHTAKGDTWMVIEILRKLNELEDI
jgi:oligoribonuclease (3'-5' exoribonuclease)